MFIDARKDDLKEISCDICIIGAGAAGITIARALPQQDLRICLLESGGLERDPATMTTTERLLAMKKRIKDEGK